MSTSVGPPPELVRDLVARALAEDIGRGDVTGAATVDATMQARGVIIAKASLVVAGIGVAEAAFRQLDADAVFTVRWGDGARCEAGETVAEVTGRARALLTRRAGRAELPAAALGHRHADRALRGRGRGPYRRPRYPQDHADAARPREVRRALRRRHQPSHRGSTPPS